MRTIKGESWNQQTEMISIGSALTEMMEDLKRLEYGSYSWASDLAEKTSHPKNN